MNISAWQLILASANWKPEFWLEPLLVRVFCYGGLLLALSSAGMLLRRLGTPITTFSIKSRMRSWKNSAIIALSQILRRKIDGRSQLATMGIVVIVALVALMGYGLRSGEVQANVVDVYYDVYVVSNPDGHFNYWLEAHDANHKPLPKLFLHFCTDFEPEFAAGQTLDILQVEHKWGCVSVANTHPGYRIRRVEGDPDGRPQAR